MLSDTLEISSVDNVSLIVVIVILLFIGGSCSSVPSMNHCIRSTGPTLETHAKDIDDLRNREASRGETDRSGKKYECMPQ